MTLSIEDRAHILKIVDPSVIKTIMNLDNIRRNEDCVLATLDKQSFSSVREIYYRQLTLHTPEWKDPEDVARDLASTGAPDTADFLECKRRYIFTADKRFAMTYHFSSAYDKAEELSKIIGANLIVEATDDEYVPF